MQSYLVIPNRDKLVYPEGASIREKVIKLSELNTTLVAKIEKLNFGIEIIEVFKAIRGVFVNIPADVDIKALEQQLDAKIVENKTLKLALL